MLLSRFPGRHHVRSSHPLPRRRFSVEVLEGRQLLATFMVTNVNDSGPGSLRQAIVSADAQSSVSTIHFNIGTGGQTISPLKTLPAVNSQVTIDATSQPGYTAVPLIAIDGSKAGASAEGLTLDGNNDQVLGLAIDHFCGDGVLIQGNNNTIASDYIGLDLLGSAAGNDGSGIIIRKGSDNTIGSVLSSGSNVISANGWRGVWIDGSTSKGNVIEGNRIGTNPAGTLGLGNGGDGVSIVNAPDNIIGGTALGAGNLISGNARVGVWVDGTTATGNVVSGNEIGTKVTGTSALGNGLSGVMTEGAPDNTIGGTTAASRNLISGNDLRGVWLDGSNSTGNVIEGNDIGTNAAGTGAIANEGDGVSIVNAPDNIVGGTTAGAGNLISGNGRVGIWLDGTTASGNVVQGNSIGTDVSGTMALGNGLSGVMAEGAPNNMIGGTTTAAGNVISANRDFGVLLRGVGATGDVVEGNLVGTNASGSAVLGNLLKGVQIDDCAGDDIIGGTTPGAGNTIANNGLTGVALLEAGKGNLVEGNVIDANGFSQKTAGLGDGVFVMCSPYSTVSTNTIEFNRDWGINLQDSGHSLVKGNTFQDNGLGNSHTS